MDKPGVTQAIDMLHHAKSREFREPFNDFSVCFGHREVGQEWLAALGLPMLPDMVEVIVHACETPLSAVFGSAAVGSSSRG